MYKRQAYDLNKIFNDTINLQHEIYSSNLTIPADEFTETPEFQHLLTYKKLTPLLLKKIRKKEKIEEHVLKTYEASNPSLYLSLIHIWTGYKTNTVQVRRY